MLAIGHIIAEQKTKDPEKEAPKQVSGSLDSLRPTIENKYSELFTYISKLEAEIQVQESLLDGRRRSKQQDIANDRSPSRNTKTNIRNSSEVGQGAKDTSNANISASNANVVPSNANDTNTNRVSSNTTPNTTSMVAPQAAKPLASMMANPSDISNAVNSNEMTAPTMTRIPNIDSNIAAQTGPMQPVMMNNPSRSSANGSINAQQQSINNGTQGSSSVDNQNKWQQAHRNQASNQLSPEASQSQAPSQNQMNAKIDLPTRDNEDLDKQQYDVDYNESLNSIDSEQVISEPIDFSADADDEQDKINSQTFTENELSIGDVDLSKLRKRVVVANEVVLRNKKIVHAMYYLDKISDPYTKDLVDAKMSETDLVFLTTANRQYVGDENHWLLSMPERLKPIIDRNYINKIANEIGTNLNREISIDVQFVDESAIESCPTIEVHKYYENLKAQKYKEFVDDQRYSNLLSELNIDVNKGQFDMLGDIK